MRFAFAVLLLLPVAATAASLPPTESTTGMVVSAQHLAAEAGVEILRQGGNAIDAAVAVGYAEAVVNPCCGNIGGGGFLTAHLPDGRDIFLDFRETAPAAATRDMYLDAAGQPLRGASLYRLESGRRPRHRARPGYRPDQIWHHAALRRHGAGDPPCARRLCAERAPTPTSLPVARRCCASTRTPHIFSCAPTCRRCRLAIAWPSLNSRQHCSPSPTADRTPSTRAASRKRSRRHPGPAAGS